MVLLFSYCVPCVLGGLGKNNNAEKVAEKLEALSVEESKESEDETKEKAEEKQ